MAMLIIALLLNLSPRIILFCPNSLNTKSYSSNLLLLVDCFIMFLLRCYSCPPFLHSKFSFLSSLFVKICCPTQVHTFVSIWKYELAFPPWNLWWNICPIFFIAINNQIIMKVVHCCLVNSLSPTHSAVIIVVVTFLTCSSCYFFLLVSLINFATSLSITFCYIMVKYSFEVTTWLSE